MEDILIPRADTASTDAVASSSKPAASWAAIVAGAVVAVAASLILLALGSGLDFAAVSPWADHGVSVTTLTVTTAIWLIVTQWISAGLGGYLAGRLRTRWIGTHSHEVFFRDTAHGLVTWAVATAAAAALVGLSVLSLAGGGVRIASAAAIASAQGMTPSASAFTASHDTDNASYGTDKLFRSPASTDGAPSLQDLRVEAGHILANAISAGSVPDADRRYLANLIVAKTGLSQAEAQTRVDEWVLIGAFIASISVALGGKLRDEHP